MRYDTALFVTCVIAAVQALTAFQFLAMTNRNSSLDPLERNSAQSRSPCTVVIYDNVRGFLNWNQEWFVKAALSQNIKIKELKDGNPSKGQGSGHKVNVVIFHAPTHKNRVSDALRKKYPGAMFAMLSMEQPNYATLLQDLSYLRQHMDLMITYSLSKVYPGTQISNLPITYYPSHILAADAVLKPVKSFAEKTGYGTGVMVALFTSNCKLAGASERLKYLQELMKHVEVHSYGGCLNNRKEPDLPNDPSWPPIAQRRARKIQVLSNYKFYLAFENAPIDDYVSEKVFEGLFAGSIPIYRGAQSIGQFMPANDSFINANAMPPVELATLIKSVGSDASKYAKYFAFKQRPLSPHFQQIADMSYVHPNVLSRVCDVAREKAGLKSR